LSAGKRSSIAVPSAASAFASAPGGAAPAPGGAAAGTADGKPKLGEEGRHVTGRLILEAGLDDHGKHAGRVPAGSILEVDLPIHEDRDFRWEPAREFGDRWDVLDGPKGRTWRPANWVPGDRSFQAFRVILRAGYGRIVFYGTDGKTAARSWSLHFYGE
jgi:hypothetical protein